MLAPMNKLNRFRKGRAGVMEAEYDEFKYESNFYKQYTKGGYATSFVITVTEIYKRWEFDMDNSNMSGHWIGIFTSKGSNTTVEFIEEVNVKKVLMKPFVKGYLKKQQALFIEDLKKALG